MFSFKIALPELDHLPIERRKAIVDSFNSSAETAALRERLGKLPFRFAAVIAMVVIGVMVLVYNIGFGYCMLAGFLCLVVGVPVGLLCQIALERRAFRRYVQKSSVDGGQP